MDAVSNHIGAAFATKGLVSTTIPTFSGDVLAACLPWLEQLEPRDPRPPRLPLLQATLGVLHDRRSTPRGHYTPGVSVHNDEGRQGLDTKRFGGLVPRGFWLERKAHEAFPSDVVAHFLFAAEVGRETEKPWERSGILGMLVRATGLQKDTASSVRSGGARRHKQKKTNLLSKETKTTSNSFFRSLAHLESTGENARQGGHQPAET